MQKETPSSGGEMGSRIRGHDWGTTPLGPMEQWPAPLRGAVDLALSAGMQIVVFWGPDYIPLYNDPYIPTIGDKHPAALGHPAVENWRETWDVLRPLLDGVRETGEPFWARDHPFLLVRHGFLEQTYFDISYSPIRLADGTVGGVLCLVSETTGRVLAERRLRTLSQVGVAASGTVTRQEVARAVVSVLGEARDDVPFALVYLLDADGDLRLAVPHGTAPARIRAGGDLQRSMTGGGSAPELSGEPFGASGPAVALVLTSGARVLGVLVCGTNPLLQPRGPYQEFFEVLTAGVSRALSAAEAHEHERRRTRELAELDDAKTAFFSNISHELRTPLALILGPLQELLDDPSLGSDQHTVLRTARRNAMRLLTLVNDVLDFTSVDSGRTRARYQPTDLTAQTAELAGVFRSSMESVGLTLRVEGEPLPEPVHLDRHMWERIVFNLLSNALKHTFAGGVTVGVRPGEGHAVVTVSDTGVGIPGHEIPNLFERFHRVSGSPSRSHEGTGIGLALARELIALHGGRIEADSRLGEGTTFTITLPYGSAHLPQDQVADAAMPYGTGPGEGLWLPIPDERAGRGATNGAAPEHSAGRSAVERILVVDDNADLREYLVRLLSPHWAVTAVADGAAALDAAREQNPDLIIADVMMPGMDGLELVRRLRADPGTRSMSIMLLSARAGKEESLTGLTAGADEYLVKPFSARELLTRVRGVLRLAAARSRHNRQLRELTEAALAINEAPSAPEVLALTEKYGRLLADSPGARVTLASGSDLRVEPPSAAVSAVSGVSGIAADGRDDTVLRQLAQLTAARLENLKQLELEHRIATTLQLALLPEVPRISGAEIVGRYRPGNDESSVGGDWYDVIRVSGDEVVLVIGDIVGKGVKAAATMGRMRNALRAYALEDPDPGRILGRLNRMTTGRYDRMHGTVLCVRLSLSTGRLQYSSAGHPPVLICRADGEADYLGGALAPLVGALPSTVFTTAETRLEPGDRLLLYTDGIVEKRSADILAGMARLRSEMVKAAGLDLDAQLESLLALVGDEDTRDDVALLGFALAGV
ncbi:SpoIIE family protein phosphatase [Streptosporangium roseum]|uniref:histidine kinase n=1 Tax=Streptosporangium roseum (strain ATCC 12428 / DSM 43021 / JCM 3005 / KCTC 9067 / NCIMB 10171 / NRRL 2505 / NI 9100) TaxID=479432 RepID=D2BFR3_STRRD|nr:SpoIIE family protein phosphatase [Streptosporangium roseum]ACZ90224.1 Signal transduction histidine kinase-like protein [Streptosporangium roseum DSM 43021]